MACDDETRVVYFRGDSYAKEFTIRDEETQEPINISGYSFELVVDSRKVPTDISTQQFITTGTIINALSGVVSFSPSTVDNDITEGTYYYKVKMTAGAIVRTAIRDKYIIL